MTFCTEAQTKFSLSHTHFAIESVHKPPFFVVFNSLPEEDRGNLVETSSRNNNVGEV